MAEVLTAAQMTAVEQAAIGAGRVTGRVLMEAAGEGVVAAILNEWPEFRGGFSGEGGAAPRPPAEAPARSISIRQKLKALVLCGPGNNGGDGYVVARLLEAGGWEVSVWALAEPGEGAPDARAMFEAWGGRPVDWGKIGAGPRPDLLVDALFGTGLARAVPGEVAEVFGRLRSAWDDADRIRRVAVDLPSGVSTDTGRVLTPEEAGVGPWAFDADLTVTFHTPKLGHYLGAGAQLRGRLVTVPLPGVDAGVADAVRLVQWGPDFAVLNKRFGHKYDHGHALIVGGPPGAGGAARMAARAALRVGAGLVSLGCPMRAVTENAVQLNAVMVKGLDGTAGLAEALEDSRINAVCLGPGLGLGSATGELVKVALQAKRGTVLDADALSRFQRAPEALFAMLHDLAVLTPHAGEFARLFPDLAERLKEGEISKVEACREAAARAGCTVLLKGTDTVIAHPDGRAAIHAAVAERAVPWLATAGSGDVLAGMLCGLLARGLQPMLAAEAAAWLHVEAARAYGPGLIAEDLPEVLPQVFRDLGF
ncbi:NAD(P)H-hydrate dehydratase [Sagittula salina]|uniref:Bifunctional NAD(P)H-hydrate repair enzyme n=1 Tax=Sagittula salina TaxID=2820268 RepID=A0A940MQ79_9RHOB|nr:NAD(P)H-hydrate dehydratase [Sagittula salina]MBP0481064.1 NAD(P)H-hydrate dehydratase [Sagittula salina]